MTTKLLVKRPYSKCPDLCPYLVYWGGISYKCSALGNKVLPGEWSGPRQAKGCPHPKKA